MPNMTIIEAAEYFGISKEAIHNRVRRGSLLVEVIDGVKYVDVNTSKTTPHAKSRTQTAKRTPTLDDRYYTLLQDQNTQLQAKVEKLELETRELRDQKEQMLVDERIKIEQIYKDKDEQLKSILNTISSQFMLAQPPEQEEEKVKEDHLEAEIEVVPSQEQTKLFPLKKYLKMNDLSKTKREKIIKRFTKFLNKDKKIIKIGKKFYLDLDRYDYSDLIR